MTQGQKIIRAKIGLLEVAKHLGNVSEACKMMDSTTKAVSSPYRRSAAANRC
jgi:hypothetical protein